jgi:hypothetical protein
MNTFVRNKILIYSLGLFFLSLLFLIIGTALIYSGYISGQIYMISFLIPLIGIGLFICSIIFLVYWPSNIIYRNWKFYGGDDKIIDEIKEAINNKKKEFESADLIISNGWIIKPKDFIFVRPQDVNWIYSTEQEYRDSIINRRIHIKTNFGLSFVVGKNKFNPFNVEKELTEQDVKMYINILNHYCKNAVIGYRKEFEKFWSKSPRKKPSKPSKDFNEKVRDYTEKQKREDYKRKNANIKRNITNKNEKI